MEFFNLLVSKNYPITNEDVIASIKHKTEYFLREFIKKGIAIPEDACIEAIRNENINCFTLAVHNCHSLSVKTFDELIIKSKSEEYLMILLTRKDFVEKYKNNEYFCYQCVTFYKYNELFLLRTHGFYVSNKSSNKAASIGNIKCLQYLYSLNLKCTDVGFLDAVIKSNVGCMNIITSNHIINHYYQSF